MKSVLIVYHQEQFDEFVKEVQDFLSSHVKQTLKERECMTVECYKNKDLVLVIGGDGTFLRASHLNKDVPMFGINPDPKRKEGFFMQSTRENYKEKLKPVLQEKFKIQKLLRLNASINGEKIKENILNEVYIGDSKPYNVFNYELEIKEKKERQRSSGILIGTPAGSHAWLKSAGGKKMSLTEKKFQYVPRELYKGTLIKKYSMKKGILDKDTELKVKPKTPGIVVVDSISPEYKIMKEDEIIITQGPYLNYIK